jgi:hypothetical protein
MHATLKPSETQHIRASHEVTEHTEPMWTKRPMLPMDEDFIVYSWLTSYSRSREGQALGANHEGDAKRRFWEEHRPIVEALIRTENVEVASDAADPTVIWGWACTSGDTVHYALVKRSLMQADREKSIELVRDLLGDRLDRACPYTREQRDLYLLGLVPREWYPSSIWFAKRVAA